MCHVVAPANKAAEEDVGQLMVTKDNEIVGRILIYSEEKRQWMILLGVRCGLVKSFLELASQFAACTAITMVPCLSKLSLVGSQRAMQGNRR